jgi:hypothetical protein
MGARGLGQPGACRKIRGICRLFSDSGGELAQYLYPNRSFVDISRLGREVFKPMAKEQKPQAKPQEKPQAKPQEKGKKK